MVKEFEKIMRLRNIYILSACLAAAFSCTEFQDENIEMNEVEKVEMTFTATICDESDAETKTILDGQLGDDLRKVLWTPGDTIGVTIRNHNPGSIAPFANTLKENSENGVFKGGIAIADQYYAIYPYKGSSWMPIAAFYGFSFEIPNVQKYIPGSFDKNVAPMAAKISGPEETFEFKNLCGVLALRLTGNERIKSISFSGKNSAGEYEYVSGTFMVDMEYEDTPSIMNGKTYSMTNPALDKVYRSVTLECDEPVILNETEGTPFYFVLPPATYETFTVMITTADGKVMLKEGTKPLTIKRADVQPTANLAYVETVSIDLNTEGLANSYIVSEAGSYSFNATVIGNGDFGIIPDAGFHTDKTVISPASAELLWNYPEGSIAGVRYSNGRISFLATGEKGNGVIAAKDAEGKILWSWHIWMTDTPQEHTYGEGRIVMDRNLGATKTDNTPDAVGLFYQWGRKDPFLLVDNGEYGYQKRFTVGASTFSSIEESISSPQTFAPDSYSWHTERNTALWQGRKTIYDPCPAGWRVPDTNTWDGLSLVSDLHGGIELTYDGSETFWYKDTPHINYWGDIEGHSNDDNAESWTTTHQYVEYFTYYGIWTAVATEPDGIPVRCMKETDTFIITVDEITDVTSSSAKISSTVQASSQYVVTSTGFVYGSTADVTLENGTIVEGLSGNGSFSAELTGLSTGVYYIRTYAVTDEGTYYSPAKMFTARGSENPSDNDMVFVVSANYSNDFYVTIPTWGTMDCTIDWGDGIVETFTGYNTNLSHKYELEDPMHYEVRISGTVTELHGCWNPNNSITEVKQWGLTGLTSMTGAFYEADMLTTICEDTIGSFIDVTTFHQAWYGCDKLTSIPENLFRYAIKATDFSYAFSHSGITSLGANLFKYCSSAENFGYMFYGCESLSQLDGNVFVGCTSVRIMRDIFHGCDALVTLPDNLFNDMVNVTTFESAFANCMGLTSIPSALFKNCTELKDFRYCFNLCNSLTEIPAGLFDNNVKVENFEYIFNSCEKLKTIPAKLFSNNINAKNFSNVFSNCTSLESVPSGLFKNCSAAENFGEAFSACFNLKTISEDMFEGCTSAQSFYGVFDYCSSLEALPPRLFASCSNATDFVFMCYCNTSLKSIPEGLFDACTKLESLHGTFSGCHNLETLPVNIFDKNRRIRVFNYCFNGCSKLTGESPYTIIDGIKYHLYEREKNAEQFVTPNSTTECFSGCTSLTDYSKIPSSWL